jgi:hypothetical protein
MTGHVGLLTPGTFQFVFRTEYGSCLRLYGVHATQFNQEKGIDVDMEG